MKDKHSIYRFIAYSLELLTLFVLQQSPQALPIISNCKPNLVLAALVIIILFEGAIISLWFSIFVGLLLDAALGIIPGTQAILLCILGYFIGYIAQNYFKKNILTALIISMLSIIIFYHMQFLLLYILKGYSEILYAYLNKCIPTIIYTWSTVIILYLPTKFFALCIKEKQDFVNLENLST
ncbi:MAG: rod shape-determining protein MreD [Oscillospiraceae bacterium]|jgi:rod shape-determining protein MreD|nr:rod shape-determining protein MreD [Oscillospiraceae bacterium]